MADPTQSNPEQESQQGTEDNTQAEHTPELPPEVGGPKGLEPTRYGDWERNGRCSDF